MLVVKPEDSSVVPMDLENTIESISNPLGNRQRLRVSVQIQHTVILYFICLFHKLPTSPLSSGATCYALLHVTTRYYTLLHIRRKRGRYFEGIKNEKAQAALYGSVIFSLV